MSDDLRSATPETRPRVAVGRLFWKFFLAFWLALLVAIVLVTALVSLHQQRAREDASSLGVGPRAELALRSAAATLEHGGVDALRDWLRDEESGRVGSGVYAVDRNGADLLGRPVPADALASARERLEQGDRRSQRIARQDEASGLLLFVAPSDGLRRPRRAAPLPLSALVAAGLLASLAFSALLAWYLTKPIRHLRGGFASLAGGALDTRVAARIGTRNDELADLGRDFDRMAAQLQQLVGAQRRLLHDVSHELRSPLARLRAAIDIARQEPARRDAMLERIERESVRVDDLVGELLTLARLDAGASHGDAEPVDVAELVESVVDDARFEARGAGRDVHYEERLGRRHAKVRADLLHRALENVIRNALKFAPPGSRIDVRAESDDAGPLRVSVADRGPGITDEEREAIFEPFHRGSAGSATQGYGLGLAIARRAIELHGGRIEATPREGGGLVVTIELPS
ncbi:MAG: ATP-binding protein [Burkholderiaceae bacterium]|nr:ATP-binding protein [Burkholderiaceae bacterium]